MPTATKVSGWDFLRADEKRGAGRADGRCEEGAGLGVGGRRGAGGRADVPRPGAGAAPGVAGVDGSVAAAGVVVGACGARGVVVGGGKVAGGVGLVPVRGAGALVSGGAGGVFAAGVGGGGVGADASGGASVRVSSAPAFSVLQEVGFQS